MTLTVLLTLGRLPKALELARALAGAGNRVIVAEPFARHLCAPSRAVAKSVKVRPPATDLNGYTEDLRRIVREEGVDVIIPISEEAPFAIIAAEAMGTGVHLASPPFRTIATLHDKLAFIETASRLGLPTPQTFSADDGRADRLKTSSDYVVKPRNGCSGIGVSFHKKGDAGPTRADRQNFVVQERAYGRLVSIQLLVRRGETVGSVAYKGTAFSGSVAVQFERVDTAEAALSWAKAFAHRFEYDGFIAFDMVLDDQATPEKVMVLECNPRLTSGVHFFHADDLAAFALGRSFSARARLKPETRLQEGHTALLEAYGQILKPRRCFKSLRNAFSTRDVLWSAHDPLPFLLMTPMSWGVLKRVAFEGMSFGEAATCDIAWRGEPSAPAEPISTPAREPQPMAVAND
ncbi:MAG: ATP-grasp domain-containing protein [Pseudomonadota bacterium]